jgi:phytoene dehydrogenase-like protein
LYSGFSQDKSNNPLKNVFQIIGEEPEWITYDRWGTAIPEGKFAAKIGFEGFQEALKMYGGEHAKEDWDKIMEKMTGKGGLSDAASAVSSMALREDKWAALTLLRFWRKLPMVIKNGGALNEPFSKVIDEVNASDEPIRNKFVLNWLDMLCFLLQGLPAEGTMSAVIAYMLNDWYKPDVILDYPRGGSGAIVEALVRGITKHDGCEVVLNSHVDEILLSSSDDDGRACGIVTVPSRGPNKGQHIAYTARDAVISNVDQVALRKLVRPGQHASFDAHMDTLVQDTPQLASFIHLHAGIDATDLPSICEELPGQWAYVRDWDCDGGIEAPRNCVLVSVPSLIDPSLAPPGKHVVHAYTPATEPWDDWKGLERGSEEYRKKKKEAADYLWTAVEQYIPDARSRSVTSVEQIGTPLTHARFLRRAKGAYGPRIEAGKAQLPQHRTPIQGLWQCGDYTFPGIGVPAAAAGGAVVANSLLGVRAHLRMLGKMSLPD